MQPAIFLDRDGTLNRDLGYLFKFEQFEVLPGVISALRIFQDLGYRLFIVSNQSGVARGYFTYDDVVRFHEQTDAFFRSQGITLDDIIFCPHHEAGTDPQYASDCDCRKPKPGMLLALAKKHGLDLASSYMVGDKRIDAQTGVNAGATGIWIRHPEGRYSELEGPAPVPAAQVDKPANLKEFTSLLDFAEHLREFDERNGTRRPVPRNR